MSFKILAIDGGGIRGVYSAHILRMIEEKLHIDLLNTFDLVVGTSTGSIIAGAITMGIPMEKVVQLYETEGASIFHRSPIRKRGFLKSRYDNTHLKKVLQDTFGEVRMGEITSRLMIPSTDIANGTVYMYKSGYDPEFTRDTKIELYKAILASCSAPTYFDPYQAGDYLLADGGLWANNPSLVGLVEAKSRLNQPIEELKIFSVGCGIGHKYYEINKVKGPWGFLTGWKQSQFIDLILNLQSISSDNMTKLLLDKSQYMRINFESDNSLTLDDTSEIAQLKSRADHNFTYQSKEIKKFITE